MAPPLVAHIIYRLDYGGLENGLVNIINRMPEDAFRHAIVCLAGFSDFRSRIRRNDVAVYSLDKRPGKDLGMYVRLWKLLRRLRPAVVHTRNLGTVDLQWVAWASGVRARVHGEHGWEASDPQGLNPRHRLIRRCCRPVIGRYVALSGDLQRWLCTHIHVPPARVRQIYNGVDTSRFAPEGDRVHLPWAGESRPFVFGTVGRLDPVKRQIALLEAIANLHRQDPQRHARARLMIVGGGPLDAALRERSRALNIDDKVWFTGPRSDIPALMRSMDVFVLPSINEGISNTILEAMATGLPVVAARVGGNPELVEDGVTGTLYDDRTEVGLTTALARYIEDPELTQRHGAAGRVRAVTKFSLDSMLNSYLELYRELAPAAGAGRTI